MVNLYEEPDLKNRDRKRWCKLYFYDGYPNYPRLVYVTSLLLLQLACIKSISSFDDTHTPVEQERPISAGQAVGVRNVQGNGGDEDHFKLCDAPLMTTAVFAC